MAAFKRRVQSFSVRGSGLDNAGNSQKAKPVGSKRSVPFAEWPAGTADGWTDGSGGAATGSQDPRAEADEAQQAGRQRQLRQSAGRVAFAPALTL